MSIMPDWLNLGSSRDFQHRALGVGGRGAGLDIAGAAVPFQDFPDRILVVAGQADQLVEIRAGDARALDHRRIRNIRNARRPPHVERRHPVPEHLRLVDDLRLALHPCHLRGDAHHRALDAHEREQRDVDQRLGERLVKTALGRGCRRAG